MTPCPLRRMQVKRQRVAAASMPFSRPVGYGEAGTWKPRKALPRKDDVQSTATSTRTRANASRSSQRSRVCRCLMSWKPSSRTTSVDGRNSTKSTSKRCATPKASQLASRAPRLESTRQRADQSLAADLRLSNFLRARGIAAPRPDRACGGRLSFTCSNLDLLAAGGIHSLQRYGPAPWRPCSLSDCAQLKLNPSTHDNS